MKEIVLGGYTFHLDEYDNHWSGWVSSATYKISGPTIFADTENELIGKLVLSIIN